MLNTPRCLKAVFPFFPIFVSFGSRLRTSRPRGYITALFNNTRTLKLKAQPTKAFSLPSIKCSAGDPSLRLLPNSVRCLNCAQRFDYRALGNSRKLGGVAEYLIDGSEKRICRLSFEFKSPHVIERRSKNSKWAPQNTKQSRWRSADLDWYSERKWQLPAHEVQ